MRMTTRDCMKLWQEQENHTTKFSIIFSNANKKTYVCVHLPIVPRLMNCTGVHHLNQNIGSFGFRCVRFLLKLLQQ